MEMWKCHLEYKQLPVPDEDSLVFWEGCRRQRLLMQQCDVCWRFRFPPSPLCRHCLSALATWRQDAGRGEVVTFCVYHAELAGPAWRGELPYVVAVIRLEYSGVNILSQLLGEAVDRVHIGRAVQVVFAQVNEQITLPKFALL
jgi:hypothetical protein